MKTKAQIAFDTIITNCFHKTLKPMGFKKKGNNFYLQLPELGQIINIQKSMYGSGEHIKFTINTGIFIPEFFLSFYKFETKIPDYPTEYSCAIRQRIGKLRGENDKWYEIDQDTDIDLLSLEMQENLDHYILPYFSNLSSKALIISGLGSMTLPLLPLTKLMLYGELKAFDKAKEEYESVIRSTRNLRELQDARELAEKYNISSN